MSKCYRKCPNRSEKVRCSRCRVEESEKLLKEQVWHLDQEYRRKILEVLEGDSEFVFSRGKRSKIEAFPVETTRLS